MRDILACLKDSYRYSKKDKDKFICLIKQWAKENLKTYDFSIEESNFALDYKQLGYLLLLLILSLYLFTFFQTSHLRIIADFYFICTIYLIQFRLVFILLTLIPSRNIVLTKNNSFDMKELYIICAHYDTKHSFKGINCDSIRYHMIGISRIIGNIVNKLHVICIILTVFLSICYICYLIDTSEIKLYSMVYDYYLIRIIFDVINALLANSAICIGVLLAFTFSFWHKSHNPGADDNTSGVVAALEIARYLDNYSNSHIKIVLFDNEEKGLIGSSQFVIKNKNILNSSNSKIINLDCIGRGKDIFVMTDRYNNNNCLNKVIEACNENNYAYMLTDIDYSDHKPFLSNGFDAVSIGRYNRKKYLWYDDFPIIDWIHGSKDTFEDIKPDKIQEVVKIVLDVIKK